MVLCVCPILSLHKDQWPHLFCSGTLYRTSCPTCTQVLPLELCGFFYFSPASLTIFGQVPEDPR